MVSWEANNTKRTIQALTSLLWTLKCQAARRERWDIHLERPVRQILLRQDKRHSTLILTIKNLWHKINLGAAPYPHTTTSRRHFSSRPNLFPLQYQGFKKTRFQLITLGQELRINNQIKLYSKSRVHRISHLWGTRPAAHKWTAVFLHLRSTLIQRVLDLPLQVKQWANRIPVLALPGPNSHLLVTLSNQRTKSISTLSSTERRKQVWFVSQVVLETWIPSNWTNLHNPLKAPKSRTFHLDSQRISCNPVAWKCKLTKSKRMVHLNMIRIVKSPQILTLLALGKLITS